jgi:uncharacterized protein (DUF2336 family)
MVQAPSRTDNAETHDTRERRELAAGAVAQLLARGFISESDRTAAHTIIEVLSRDAEMRVRRLLAETIAHYDRLPHHTAERLAHDVEAVAIPMLKRSPVFGDEFLIALIAAQGTSEAKQIAIAERERVSPEVGQALVETENENVVGALLGNAGATIAEHSLQKAAADHKDKSNILRLIGERPEATAELARTCRSLLLEDSLDQSMAKEMRAMLTDEHNLPELLAEELTQAALERAIVERISTARDNTELASFARSLETQGRLTTTLLFRALCAGRLDFFEVAMSILARVPRKEVAQAIAPSEIEGFRRLYAQARLGAYMRRAIFVAALTVAERRASGRAFDAEECDAAIVQKVVAFYRTIAPGPLDHVIAQLERNARGAPSSQPG